MRRLLSVLTPKTIASIAAVTALFLVNTTSAFAQMAGPLNVEIIDRQTGYPLPIYQSQGQLWVEGRPGAAYSVRLNNQSNERLLAVTSVDGINVITGETAAVNQSGYVLNPWQTTAVNGWRKTNTEVAQFYFTSLPDSYAGRTGRPNNVGVIGVALFNEYRPATPQYPEPYWQKNAPAAESAQAPGAIQKNAPLPSPSIGTGHGRREYSYSQNTAFQRASQQPMSWLQIRYDSRENLITMGVIPMPFGYTNAPQAFPAYPQQPQFTPDPPRWR